MSTLPLLPLLKLTYAHPACVKVGGAGASLGGGPARSVPTQICMQFGASGSVVGSDSQTTPESCVSPRSPQTIDSGSADSSRLTRYLRPVVSSTSVTSLIWRLRTRPQV